MKLQQIKQFQDSTFFVIRNLKQKTLTGSVIAPININTGRLQTFRKFIVNPAFAKRSVDGALSSLQFKKGTREKFKIDRKQMHASKNKRQFLKSEHMEAARVEFHRSSRGALYQKIETMLRGYVLASVYSIRRFADSSPLLLVSCCICPQLFL